MIVRHTAEALGETVSIFSEDGAYRYWHRRESTADLLKPARRILWGLCNPSVAGQAREDGSIKSDKTISTCVGFGERMGATDHGFLNLLGRIGTDPESLLGCPDPDGPDNAEVWAAAFQWLMAGPRPILVFAWGGRLWNDRQPGGRDLLNARSRSIARAVALAKEHLISGQCLGTTEAGEPRHPSRLGYDALDRLAYWKAP